MAGQIVNQAQTATPGTPVTVLHVSTTSQATTGTSEEVLATYTMPANTLSANGKAIRVTAWGTAAANANTKTVRIRFGGIGGATVSINSGNFNATPFRAVAEIVRTGAATQTASGTNTWNVNPQTTYGEPTQTLSNAVDVVVTGLTPTAAGDLTFKGMIVEALN